MELDIAFKIVIILNVLFGIFIWYQARQMKKRDIDNDIKHKIKYLYDEKETIWVRIDEMRKKQDEVCERISRIEGKLEGIYKVINGSK